MASSCDAETLTAYLRVGAICIAIYDGLWTIPAEIALYRQQKSFRYMTRACILFILIRYISILAIVVSNIGFFDRSFTEADCLKFYLIAPSLKAIQTTVSQTIVAVRTIAVARQARWVIWLVGVLFLVSVMLEFLSNIWRRVPFREPAGQFRANCTSGNEKEHKIVWVHYMAAMCYDATCLTIVAGFILARAHDKGARQTSAGLSLDKLSKLLLKEGIVYFCFLTSVNVFNLVLYYVSSDQAQSAGATLGYVMTWIMSQRLLIHLQEFKSHRSRSASLPHILPLSPSTKSKSSPGLSHFITSYNSMDFGVHVTIEEDVKVDYDEDLDITDAHDRRYLGDSVKAKELAPHRITGARIEREHRKREERRLRSRSQECDYGMTTEERERGRGSVQVTSAGKIFSP